MPVCCTTHPTKASLPGPRQVLGLWLEMAQEFFNTSHNLGDACGQRVRWLPVSPAGPTDLDGRAIAHKPFAIGLWDAVVEVRGADRSNSKEEELAK